MTTGAEDSVELDQGLEKVHRSWPSSGHLVSARIENESDRLERSEAVVLRPLVSNVATRWTIIDSKSPQVAHMNYLSEVMKILDGALRHNVDQASRYASLLAEKLDGDGQAAQATMIRERLARVPKPGLAASSLDLLPVDKETRSALVDEERPVPGQELSFFSPSINARFEEFITSVRRNEELIAAGVHSSPRMLIYGPPGCGKTLAARVIAAELGLPLLTVRCDALVSSLLGQTGRNLRTVFDHAAERPCVLFLDEFDALGKSRAHHSEIGELQRVVIAMLQNLDGLPIDTIVLAATNHEELLDRAVWRRFPFVVPMEHPAQDQRFEMWKSLAGKFFSSERDVHVMAELSEGLSGAAIRTVSHDILRDAILSGRQSVSLPLAARRLAKIKWVAEGVEVEGNKEEMRALRNWAPRVFTWKVIGDLYSMSARQVQKVLGESNERLGEADSVRGGLAGGLLR